MQPLPRFKRNTTLVWKSCGENWLGLKATEFSHWIILMVQHLNRLGKLPLRPVVVMRAAWRRLVCDVNGGNLTNTDVWEEITQILCCFFFLSSACSGTVKPVGSLLKCTFPSMWHTHTRTHTVIHAYTHTHTIILAQWGQVLCVDMRTSWSAPLTSEGD